MEQVLLSSYYIGLALSETKIVYGAMADIGLSYEDAKNICPTDIDIICNMSQNTCSISGPKKSVTAFITKLQVLLYIFSDLIKYFIFNKINYINNNILNCYLYFFRLITSLLKKLTAAIFLFTVIISHLQKRRFWLI